MRRKIVFLDIDGTLTEPGGLEPPASAVRAIRGARRNGHLIYLCTGRNYAMLKDLLAYGFDGFVASAGGYIRCGQEVIYDCPMTEEERQALMDVLEKNGVCRTLECLHGTYIDGNFKEFLRSHASEGRNSELLRWREQVERTLNIRPMEEYRGEPVYKIVFMCLSPEQLEEPKQLMEGAFVFSMEKYDRYGCTNGELINRRFDKGRAIARACAHLGIPIADALAFGDSINDAEALRAAGVGICMENGSEELKRIADDICPAVSADGIAWTFEKYGLCGQNCRSI